MSENDRKHAPWHLWILIIFWVLQYLFLVLEILIIIVALVVIARSPADFEKGTIAGASVETILIFLTLAFTIAEPILLVRKRLTPKFYTISSLIKTVIWVAIIIAAAVLNAKRGQYNSSSVSIIITFVLVALFAIPTLYGGAIWIRENKGQQASIEPIVV